MIETIKKFVCTPCGKFILGTISYIVLATVSFLGCYFGMDTPDLPVCITLTFFGPFALLILISVIAFLFIIIMLIFRTSKDAIIKTRNQMRSDTV